MVLFGSSTAENKLIKLPEDSEVFNYPSVPLYPLSDDNLEEAEPATSGSDSASRLSIVHAMEMSVDILVTYGVSAAGVDLLRTQGFTNVQDLASLQLAAIGVLGHSALDVGPLTRLCVDVQEESYKAKLRLRAEVDARMRMSGMGVKNTFINFRAPPQFSSLEQVGGFHSAPVAPLFPGEEPVSTVSSLADEIEEFNRLYSYFEPITPAPVPVSPVETLAGAAEHHCGGCKPCAWFHHADGCKHGVECEFCHLCPVGEIKRRKKEKHQMMKAMKGQQQAASDPLVSRTSVRTPGFRPSTTPPAESKRGSWFRGMMS